MRATVRSVVATLIRASRHTGRRSPDRVDAGSAHAGAARAVAGQHGDMPEERVWTVEDHLRGQDPRSVALFDAVDEAIRACGPVRVSVSRTTITYKGTRRGFAGARPTRQGVRGYLDLTRTVEGDPRILSVSPYTQRLFVHQYRLATPGDLDGGFRALLREAYDVGRGAHLLR